MVTTQNHFCLTLSSLLQTINTRQTKVKLILSCMMEKVDLKCGEVIAKEAAFHSKTEVNLESTDSNKLFSKINETVLVSLENFKDKEVIGGSIQFEFVPSHSEVCATSWFLLHFSSQVSSSKKSDHQS